jgi:hypothetical protein
VVALQVYAWPDFTTRLSSWQRGEEGPGGGGWQRGGAGRQRAHEGNTQLDLQAISFLANLFCNGANVPSSNAALYDNEGLAPFAATGPPICP